MSAAKHTPGPWDIEPAGNGCFDVYREANEGEAAPVACDCSEDDARLIAAAPKLLAAAQCAANVLVLLKPEVDALGLRAGNVPDMLRAAIAKATGDAA